MGRRTPVAAALAIAGLALGAATPAHAAAVTVTGAAQLTPAPPSLARGALESNTAVRVIDESSVTLGASLTLWTVNASGALTQASWSAGVCLQSHLLHADAVGTSATPSLSGTVSFSQPIVGVLPVNDPITRALDRSDGPSGAFAFGLPGSTYPAAGDSGRGIEVLNLSPDLLSLPSASTLGFTFRNDGFDQVRVLTTCDPSPVIPEVPLSLLLPASALALLAGVTVLGRRRLAA